MYIRPHHRQINGKRQAYWELVESYRTALGPRQRVVAYLGWLDEAGRLGVAQAAQRGSGGRQVQLFHDVEPEWIEVDAAGVGLFEIHVRGRPDGGAQVEWSKVQAHRGWAHWGEGCYLLRSNIDDWTGEDLWSAYIQLTDAEAAFRIHKSDLSIRPIWHQHGHRVQAHILVCFLAYVLWKTLRQLCGRAGLGEEPRRVFQAIAQIRMVDVVLPTRQGIEIRKRCVTQPTDHQAILLHHLGLGLPTGAKLTEM